MVELMKDVIEKKDRVITDSVHALRVHAWLWAALRQEEQDRLEMEDD
jgi:hypothetical protein